MALVVPYLTLMTEGAPQRDFPLREVFNRLRWIIRVSELAKRVQEETGETVEIAFVNQGYTGENAAGAAKERGIKLEVAPLPTARRGFVLSPR